MRFKFMSLVFAAGLGATQIASAADLAVHMPSKAPPMMAARTWTGCYLGGNVGVGWAHNQINDETPPHVLYATLDDTNIVGGGQIGCDYEFADNWVIGLQGMFDGTGLNASGTSIYIAPGILNGNIPWFATVTGRLGYVVSPAWLVYAKGGGVWTHVESNITSGSTVVSSATFDQSGWTAGGGAEWRFAPHWSVFAEYDYLKPSDKTVTMSGIVTNIGTVKSTVQTALVGLNFRFSGLMH